LQGLEINGKRKNFPAMIALRPSVLRLARVRAAGSVQTEAAEAFLELRHLAAAVYQAMLAGPGRVGFGVDLEAQYIAFGAVGRAGLELAAVGHYDGDRVVFRMDIFFHRL